MPEINESEQTVNVVSDSDTTANTEGSNTTEEPSSNEAVMSKLTEVLELLSTINLGIQAVQTQKVALDDDSKLLISQVSQKTVEVGEKLDSYLEKAEGLSTNLDTFNTSSSKYNELLGKTLDGIQDLNVSIQSMVSLLSTIHETQTSITAVAKSIENISSSLHGVTNSVDNSANQISKYIVEVRSEVLQYMEAAGSLNNSLDLSKELVATLNNLSGNLDVKIASISNDINSLTSILRNLNEVSANLLSNIRFEDKVKTGSDVIKNIAIGIGAMKYTLQKENTL